MIVTIDTNVMIPLFIKGAKHREILRALIDGRLQLAISTSIRFEYEEVLRLKVGSATWQKILRSFELLAVSQATSHNPSLRMSLFGSIFCKNDSHVGNRGNRGNRVDTPDTPP